MEKLTVKEEECMEFFWVKGPLFVKDLLELYPEPKPHVNTLSTVVRGLEAKGFLNHKTYGNTYQYFALKSREEFKKGSLKEVVMRYFNNSYMSAVSTLVKDEKISVDELRELIRMVENQ